MNKRIRELYDQALETKFDYGGGVGIKPGEYYSNYITVLNPEKFAELIVRECGVALSPMLRDMISRGRAYDMIKQHFGVEE